MAYFKKPRKILLFSLFLFISSVCSGCATTLLWNHQQGVRAEKLMIGEADQIYVSYDKGKIDDSHGESKAVNFKTYCVPFHIKQDQKENKSFPGVLDGFLIIKEKGSYIPGNPDSFIKTNYEALFKSLISPIDLYAIKVDKNNSWELNVTFKLPSVIGTYFKDRESSSLVGSRSQHVEAIPPFHSYFHYPSIILPSDFSYNYKPDGSHLYYYSLCCYKSDAVILKEFDTSGWMAILPQEKQPLPIKFYLFRPEKIYDYPLVIRSIGTPLTVAFDVVTSPLQLLFFMAWEHGGPR